MQDAPAQWLTIVGEDNKHDYLSKLLGLSYKKIIYRLCYSAG
jgi:hypothetical protein